MRQLLRQVLHGKHGAYYIIAEYTRELQQIGLHAKRIPAFLIPDEATFAPQQQDTMESKANTHEKIT